MAESRAGKFAALRHTSTVRQRIQLDFGDGAPRLTRMSQTHADGTQHVTIDEVVTTVIMARVTDFFGFFVYLIACLSLHVIFSIEYENVYGYFS